MLTVLAANALNIGLNWVLIFGNLGAPSLGAVGSAWGTSVSRWFLVLLVGALPQRYPPSLRPCTEGPAVRNNGGMPDAKPWSRLKAEVYSLIGRNPKSNRLVVDLAEVAPDHATLDVGCGPGAAVRVAAPLVRRASGVDNSDAMVRIAARRSAEMPNVDFHVGSAEALPFDDATFDRLWTVHAFHHWSDQSAGLAEALRVLRPGGRLLVVERRSGGDHGLTAAGADRLAHTLIDAGFRDAHVAQHGKQMVIAAEA